jgi:hypothetical protein
MVDQINSNKYTYDHYWNERYEDSPKSMCDWYLTWNQFKKILDPILQDKGKNASILVVGCGNSSKLYSVEIDYERIEWTFVQRLQKYYKY